MPVTFTMGSPASEPCRWGHEEDQRQVTLTHRFEIMAHEVTQGDFQALMGYNSTTLPSCGSSCPVELVPWYAAAAYCNELSAKAGLAKCYSCSGNGTSLYCSEAPSYSEQKIYDCPGYRLPTEAEWEFAYRAGTTTAYYSGANDPKLCMEYAPKDANADKIAWYVANSEATTHPVGQKAPNNWGLYDMAGNAYEWCHDWPESYGSKAVTDPWGSASGSYRALRGGSWFTLPTNLRAAHRTANKPALAFMCGFRCARTK